MDVQKLAELIRARREALGLTQAQLAEGLCVGDKAVSKWETAKGLPDITLLEPLAAALGLSVGELMQGQPVVNANRGGNLLRGRFFVCPLCGNVIHSLGAAHITCCGITLPPLLAEGAEGVHEIFVEPVEDEQLITLDHPMTKEHFISFVAFVTADRLQLVKLYPEGDALTRLQLRGRGMLYAYCNRHGLFARRI